MRIEQEPKRKRNYKKLLAGVGLAGGDFAINRSIEVFSVAEASTLGFMKPVIDNHPGIALGVVMGVATVVSAVNSIQNLRLNREFNLSPNGFSTLTYHLINKRWPSKTNLRDGATWLSQLVFTKDPFLIAPALVDEKALVALLTLKSATTAFSVVKSLGSEVVLRKAGKEKKRIKEQGIKEVAASGLIFAADPRIVSVTAGD